MDVSFFSGTNPKLALYNSSLSELIQEADTMQAKAWTDVCIYMFREALRAFVFEAEAYMSNAREGTASP